MQLPVPSKSSCQGPGPLQLSLVHVCEESAPDNLEPLEWFLLTSLPVTSRQQALKILEWYRLRWRIEDWHRVLKSGCKVEYLGHRTGERIERAVTINAVIAWRLTAMTLLGRDTPELPADILFSDIEIIALEDFAKDRKLLPHRPTRDCSGWTGPAISISDCVPIRLVGKRQGAGRRQQCSGRNRTGSADPHQR